MFVIAFLGVTALCCAVHLFIKRKKWSSRMLVDVLLLYVLLINVGLAGLLAFYGHAFRSDQVAASIGWAAGSPFQLEVAMTNLAFGVLGVLCIFFREEFWLATGIGYAVFLFGAAFVHLREIISAGNYAINNAGPILYIGDIAIPLLILVLLLIKWRMKPSGV
ncbi:MAG: DUF6790 family protein [Smithellaceae bacterium]